MAKRKGCEGCRRGLPIAYQGWLGKYHYVWTPAFGDSTREFAGRCSSKAPLTKQEPDNKPNFSGLKGE